MSNTAEGGDQKDYADRKRRLEFKGNLDTPARLMEDSLPFFFTSLILFPWTKKKGKNMLKKKTHLKWKNLCKNLCKNLSAFLRSVLLHCQITQIKLGQELVLLLCVNACRK